MKYFLQPKNERGYVISIVTFFVLTILVALALSMAAMITYRQQIATNSILSTQAYYAAEGGTEDALVQLKKNSGMAAKNYTVTINSTTAAVTIPDILAGSRTIVVQGNDNNRDRTIQTVYSVDSQGVAFHYGAQVGAGGLSMNNGSEVQGNVFSNGSITGAGTIDNNAVVAGAGNMISGPHIKGDATANSCKSSTVGGNLMYVTGGINTCTVSGTTTTQSSQIASQPMPITQGQIDGWKQDSTNGTVINGNYSVTNGQVKTLGPAKITGTLTLDNNATLKLTGTVYVVGNVSISNNSVIELDSSYGSLGGVLLTDGVVSTGNNAYFLGSGQAGSYILVLSTNTADNAITVSNNATGAIFYTSAGGVTMSNNSQVKEVTGYKVVLNNNVIIKYDSGLQSTLFSSGPSAGWNVTSWQEK